MPKPGADDVLTQQHARNFIQIGGARPNNALRYAGQEGQHMMVGAVDHPVSGGITPVRVPDPYKRKRYKNVARTTDPADLPSTTLTLLEEHGYLPRALGDMGCQFNLYISMGRCKDASDFLNGWESYMEILSGAEVTDRSHSDRTAWDSDEALSTELTLTLDDHYGIGTLAFGEKAASNIDREVLDVIYGNSYQCAQCGPDNDGTNWIYAITKSSGSGSPGLPSELIYSTDGGATWAEASITGIGASEDPIAIEIAGDKLIVLSRTAGSATLGGYYYATINQLTGAPGAFTKVTSGFVTSRQPNDIYVIGPGAIFFAADGGYIYKSTDIASGVTVLSAGNATTNNLYRINGDGGKTIVATGQGATVIKSVNQGDTFAATTASISGVAVDVTALAVMDELLFWVGTGASGRLFYTINGGETWTEQSFSGSGSGTIRDIIAASNEVLYFSHDTNAPVGRLFASVNGGYSWALSSSANPRLINVPTVNRFTRLAVPTAGVTQTNANEIAVAGLSSGGTDGILALGVAAIR